MKLDPVCIESIVDAALREDIGDGDRTTAAVLPDDGRARARLVAGAAAVIAGLDLAAATFRRLDPDCQCDPSVADGDRVVPGETLMQLTGAARALLGGERTACNFLQHLSGIATRTAAYRATQTAGGAVLLDTRKTTPGLRHLEKYAVQVGGAANHRIGLFDGILIKENHRRLAGGVGEAVRRARRRDTGFPIEVEVDSLEEYDEALAAGADIILLDNMSPEQVRHAVERRPEGVLLEASGGITPDNLPRYERTGVDRISAGGLIHAATWVDISMEVDGWAER